MTMTVQEPARVASLGEFQDELKKNVGSSERVMSAAAGGVLSALAFRRGGLAGLAMLGAGAALLRRGFTGHCGLYQSIGVDTSGKAAEPGEYAARGIHLEQTFTIQKSPGELFQYWRDFQNLPRIMRHLENVRVLDHKRSHWTAKAPAGTSVQWDAEIINEVPNELIAWRSLDGADVHNSGTVRFVDTGDRGTEVHVILAYIPPAGRLGSWIAWLFGEEPNQQIREDLRRFKQMMEAGEVPTTQGQPRGECDTMHNHRRMRHNGHAKASRHS